MDADGIWSMDGTASVVDGGSVILLGTDRLVARESNLRRILVDRLVDSGLTSDEARALLRVAGDAIFDVEGERLVLLTEQFGPTDLPVTFEPWPEEDIRVAVVCVDVEANSPTSEESER